MFICTSAFCMSCTTGLLGEQHLALTGHGPHHADFAARSPGSAQQPETHELLQPLN